MLILFLVKLSKDNLRERERRKLIKINSLRQGEVAILLQMVGVSEYF